MKKQDTIIYTWTYESLHELIELHPSIGVIIERCISSDLNKKLDANIKNNLPKIHYRKLLISCSKLGQVIC